MKIAQVLKKRFAYFTSELEKRLRQGLKDRDMHLRILAAVPLILCVILVLSTYKSLNDLIPMWYTKPWGSQMFTSRSNIWVIPIVSILFTAFALVLAYFSKKFYLTFLSQILLVSAFVYNTATLLSTARIIYISSPAPILSTIKISNQTQSLLMLLILGFFSSCLLLPKFITWAFKKNLVTDPTQHKHPGMILAKPSARGGGFVFSFLFVLISLLFLEKSPIILGITISVMLCGIIGFLDDWQNTHSNSKLNFLENPFVRLFLFLPIPVVLMMAFGVVSGYINNPLDGNIVLADFKVNIAGDLIAPLPYMFTLIWTLAIMNMISWSNGVDGQFGGVAGISTLIIGVLALRLVGAEPAQLNTAKLAFLAAGLSFGFIPHTWHPSKIMWGFGAISIGLLLSSLSIVSRAKVATAIMVIMVPFLDGFITIVRRLVQKKNPLKGDRGHLHHLLLERGWSPKKVAVFYWAATAFFGVIGLLSADKASALIMLTLGGVVATAIVVLNISSEIGKHRKVRESEEGISQSPEPA